MRVHLKHSREIYNCLLEHLKALVNLGSLEQVFLIFWHQLNAFSKWVQSSLISPKYDVLLPNKLVTVQFLIVYDHGCLSGSLTVILHSLWILPLVLSCFKQALLLLKNQLETILQDPDSSLVLFCLSVNGSHLECNSII